VAASIIVGAIQLFGTGLAAASQTHRPGRALDALAYALLLAGPAALAVRRRWPLVSLAVAVASVALYMAFGYPPGPFFVAAVVALLSAATRVPRWRIWAITGAAYGLNLGIALTRGTATWADSISAAAWTAVVLVLTDAARVRAAHIAEMARTRFEAERARQEAQRARAEQARRQAADERLRIARELHDVLGHHLSLINVRAGVALHLLDSQPEQTREALSAIKQASAEALREVRGVLATLRPADESPPRAPAPGLADVEALGDGLDLTVVRTGEVTALPAEVDRAAYRIVQESLTNVRRHAGPAAAVTVSLDYAPTELHIRVDDTGPGCESTQDGSGIPGMRERAAALGGRLVAGPGPTGGFRVEASLPLSAGVKA
jgi:signal transduction histidine kinase